MKIALAHDSFTQQGGAERVVDCLHEMFPEAPIFTTVLDRRLRGRYKGWQINTSWLQHAYSVVPKLQLLLPLIPPAVSSLDFKGFDLVISSSSSFIKNIRVPAGCTHVDYCHTPTRFLWVDKEYVNQEVPKALRPLARMFLAGMKKWDLSGAQRVDHFIANSKEVKNRISEHYHRDSSVVYPPVDTDFWRPSGPKKDYFLLAGRLQAHKRNDFIVEIFNDLGLELHVVGTGRQERYLKSIARDNIKFFGRVSDEDLRVQYSGAAAYIFPQYEDLGLMPIEAAACGTATLGLAKGGSLETIIAGKTGEHFDGYNEEKVKKLILGWQPEKYKQEDLRSHAETFSAQKFKENILSALKTYGKGA